MKNFLAVIGGITLTVFGVGAAVVLVINFMQHKLICTSDIGDITITYNDQTITRYKANGFQYNLESQQEYVEEVGINTYIVEFKDNFREVTKGGNCTIE